MTFLIVLYCADELHGGLSVALQALIAISVTVLVIIIVGVVVIVIFIRRRRQYLEGKNE